TRQAWRRLDYRDLNFPDRVGWKEVVAVAGPGVTLSSSSVPERGRSRELADYPTDMLNSPPQTLEAEPGFGGERLVVGNSVDPPDLLPVERIRQRRRIASQCPRARPSPPCPKRPFPNPGRWSAAARSWRSSRTVAQCERMPSPIWSESGRPG